MKDVQKSNQFNETTIFYILLGYILIFISLSLFIFVFIDDATEVYYPIKVVEESARVPFLCRLIIDSFKITMVLSPVIVTADASCFLAFTLTITLEVHQFETFCREAYLNVVSNFQNCDLHSVETKVVMLVKKHIQIRR